MMTTGKALALYSYYQSILRDGGYARLDCLGVRTLWALKRAMDQLGEVAKSFEEFRKNRAALVLKEFYSDEKSEATETGRQVKAEYMPAFREATQAVDRKLAEALSTPVSLDVTVIDLDALIGGLADAGTSLTLPDLEMLSILGGGKKNV